MRSSVDQFVAPPAGTTGGQEAGAAVFNIRKSDFVVLLSKGFNAADSAAASWHWAPEGSRYAGAGVALQHLNTAGTWLLVYPRQHISVMSRDSLLALSERQLMLIRGDDVSPASFHDFRGTALLLREAAMSPHDRKLLTQRTENIRLDNGWSRLLEAYLETLDSATLAFVSREESGGALVEQQLMALLRRALRERLNGNRSWVRRDNVELRAQSRGELLYRNIKAWVSEHYAMPELSSEVVANHFQVSPRYIQNLFSRYGEGVTFVSFLRERRLRQAMKILMDPQHAHQSIAEICWNCGFADPVYFGKVFRELYGITPGQARKQAFAVEA